jgi:hypothetical protein
VVEKREAVVLVVDWGLRNGEIWNALKVMIVILHWTCGASLG